MRFILLSICPLDISFKIYIISLYKLPESFFMQKGKLIIFPLVFILAFGISTFTVLADDSFNLLPAGENEEEYSDEIPSESEIITVENEHPSDEWSEDDFRDVQPIPMPTPIVVPPPGTYSDENEEGDELEGPVSEDVGSVEGTLIDPEDLPVEKTDGDGNTEVPPPGTYTDDQEENNELEKPESEEGGFVEGSIINPEDLPVEDSEDHTETIVVPPPGTPPPSDNHIDIEDYPRPL